VKIASFHDTGALSYGVVARDGVISASTGFRRRYPTLKQVLEGGALGMLREDTTGRPPDRSLDDLRFAPPLHNAGKVICVGINYPKRYPLDNPAPPPDNIILFAKLEGTLVGHGAELEPPPGPAAESFDYEGEIVLVIGKPGRHIQRANAFEHVAGYTIMDDGSVRAWQKHSVHAGKNFANSGACGPWMVTADEIENPAAMALTTRLNGEQVQHTTAAEMIFPIPELIAYISHTIDLKPGDLIATGSPEGAGGSRRPPRFLRPGDRLEIEVSGIGVLKNTVGSPGPIDGEPR